METAEEIDDLFLGDAEVLFNALFIYSNIIELILRNIG